MASVLVIQKIESLQRCLKRIEDKRPASVEALAADIDAQDIISINLERAVQRCVDIAMGLLSDANKPVPATMAEAFESLAEINRISETTALRMCKAVGFRNIAVHAYRKVDWNIVWKIITEHLTDFRTFIDEVHR
jgi:uncharacterized protein YutE (UPF0331/DUF86 family)